MHSPIRALLFRKPHPLAAAALGLCILMPGSALAQNAASEAALERHASKADKDCEDIVFPDGSVAECPSPAASQTAAIAHSKHEADVVCPPPTREDGARRCVLDSDVVLDEPLRLDSFTRLDCGGYTMRPRVVGTPRITTPPPAKPRVISTPEVAIVLMKAHGVTIENCHIGTVASPFDFGVMVLGSKLPAEVLGDQGAIHQLQNTVQDNSIATRYNGVIIGESDDTTVKDNEVRSMVGARGVGIDLLGDSDINRLEGNTVIADSPNVSTSVPLFPGALSTPQRLRGIRLNVGNAAVSSFCMDGELIQILARQDIRQEDNVVEGNFVDVGLLTSPFGIATAAGVVRPLLSGNTIVGAHQALHFSGIAPGDDFGIPGHCSFDAQRACGVNADCNIAGCDEVSKGTCVGASTVNNLSIGATDPLVVGNTVDGSTGKVEIGIYLAIPPPHATVLQNTVSQASLAGIRLNNGNMEFTTVKGNTLFGNRFGLVLAELPGIPQETQFGSAISLNDIVGSTRQAIATGVCKVVVTTACNTNADCGASGPCLLRPTALPTELSVDGQGNYWGRTCADSDGFRNFDEPDALGLRDTSAPNVTDSHPYGVPVAGGVDQTTLTCR
jgi:Periplasmic copper-binding protein (NosD)